MSRDDRFALGVLLILALSIPFFLLHRWSQREDTYSAVGAKPLDSAKSILINPVPGADASRAQAPSRLPSLTLPDAPPGAPAQSASDSAPVSAAVEEPPSAPEDAAYGSPVSGAPRPSLAASRSGLSDPGGGGGAAAGASRGHSNSQVIVTPVVPRLVQDALRGSQRFFEYRDRCIFCDMVEQEIRMGSAW